MSPTRQKFMHRLGIVAMVLLVSIMVFSSGCVFLQSSGEPLGVDVPAVTKDNSGGAIAIYEVPKRRDERDFYAQRVSAEGDFLWGEKGTLIGSGYKKGGSFWGLNIIDNGSGGAIIAWSAHPSRPNWGLPSYERHMSRVVYITKVDSEGNILWRKDFPGQETAIFFGTMVGDGFGGVIIAFVSYSEEISLSVVNLLRIDSEGNLCWGEDGISIYYNGSEKAVQIASDNLGGAILVWETTGNSMLAQRIDSKGNILWQEGGLLVSNGPAEGSQLISDDSGGAIIAYMRMIPSEEHKHSYSGSDIYAQRVDAEGNILWRPDGVPICVGPSNPESPRIVSDGSGGAIIFFYEYEPSICAQRIDGNGARLWSEDDIASGDYRIVSDGSGEVIIVSCNYIKERDMLRAQKFDATGEKLWGRNGVLIPKGFWGYCTDTMTSRHGMSEDGCGGVIVSWLAGKSRRMSRTKLSYVQRLDAQGNLVWGEKGVLLSR